MSQKTVHLKLSEAVKALAPEAVNLLVKLVQIPSLNHPPYGDERAVQEFYHGYLLKHGLDSKILDPADIPAFSDHPARLPERDMKGRPNVSATLKGTGKGRSLLLMAHADTEEIGNAADWCDDPFSGILREGRIYGRGSGDDKCGMAIAAILPLILKKAEIKLRGDLTIASVSDEEQGGGNGTAALLASGIHANAALYLDGSNQTIWNAGLGGGFAEVIITSDTYHELHKLTGNATQIIIGVKNEIMKAVIAHPDFGEDFFLNDLSHGFFNIRQTKLAPNTTKLSFFLDTLPGDNEENLKWHVESKLRANGNMEIKWMSRFLKPAPKLKDDHPLVRELSASFETATGRKAKIGPGRQSDQGLVSHYGKIPCVLFGCGRRGLDGAPHLPNEYVVIDEFLENLLTAANFAVNWCGHA